MFEVWYRGDIYIGSFNTKAEAEEAIIANEEADRINCCYRTKSYYIVEY